ncbi:MAG: 3-deoxy-D-manno-octulosonic acid transferase [Henriciella sp.]|nr:3-deoxy-D-manno-octulosonic acid transferase [Henriciella sp.]
MRFGLALYRFGSRLLSPFIGVILSRRVRSGKEAPERLNQRYAKQLPARPSGPLIWFHAASVGESLIQLELAATLLASRANTGLIFTCQTLTGAKTINQRLTTDSRFRDCWHLQQMAPVDTPGTAQRFVRHWHPDLAIFAEGEIWPNLLTQLRRNDIPAALINARMTEKSISGWRRWPRTAPAVVGSFAVIVASNQKTATALARLSDQPVPCPGNLKSALPLPQVSQNELSHLEKPIADRPVLVAASTHDGEEALILEALLKITPRPFTIIAPRHPERGDQIESLLRTSGLAYARRSRDDEVTAQKEILLADTIGEMGLWYRLANTVYLGGGHTPGIGGHNPLGPFRLGRPVMTGSSLFNFEEMADSLIKQGGLIIVHTAQDIAEAFPATPPAPTLLARLEADAAGPMKATLAALEPYLSKHGSVT